MTYRRLVAILVRLRETVRGHHSQATRQCLLSGNTAGSRREPTLCSPIGPSGATCWWW